MMERLPAWARRIVVVLRRAAAGYGRHRVGRMAAAVAFRAVFALTPLLAVAVWVAGLVGASVRLEVVASVTAVAGAPVGELVADLLVSAGRAAAAAALLSLGLLLWTGSGLFLEVQSALDDILGTPPEKVSGVVDFARRRGLAFLWSLGLGLMLLVVMAVNTMWRFAAGLLPEGAVVLHRVVSYLTPVVSLALLPVVLRFAMQTLSRARIPAPALRVGTVVSSLGFVAVAHGLGVYFEQFRAPSAIGLAGSAAVIIFLSYVLAAVFLFGVEITRVYIEDGAS